MSNCYKDLIEPISKFAFEAKGFWFRAKRSQKCGGISGYFEKFLTSCSRNPGTFEPEWNFEMGSSMARRNKILCTYLYIDRNYENAQSIVC